MIPLSVVIDRSSNLDAIRTQLGPVFAVEFRDLEQVDEIEPREDVVFDIDVLKCPIFQKLNTGSAIKLNAARLFRCRQGIVACAGPGSRVRRVRRCEPPNCRRRGHDNSAGGF
jgi:hypothetical protein